MEFLYEDEVDAKDVVHASVVICPFDETEIDDMDFRRFDALVDVLEKCGMAGRAKVLLQFLYDGGPAEAFEHTEVCKYARELFVRCPHLYYFLLPNRAINGALFLCQSGAESISISEDGSMSAGAMLSASMKSVAESAHTALKEYGFGSNDPVGAMVVLNELGFLCID
jgi:hypothetical protein